MDGTALFSLKLSVQVGLMATLLVAAIGVPVAYLLSRKDFRGKGLLDAAFTLPLVLPPTVTGYYLIVLLGRNGILGRPVYEWTGWSIMFTWHAAVAASFAVSLPLMIKASKAAMESVDRNLIDASYTLGHSELKTALRVVVPLAKKGIIAGAALSFARALGEFGATLMLAGNIPGKTDTMPLAIYSAIGSGDWGKANAMVAFFTVVSGVFLYASNRLGRLSRRDLWRA